MGLYRIKIFKMIFFFPNATESEEPKGSVGFLSFLHSAHAHKGKEEVWSKPLNGSARPRGGEVLCAQ